MEIIFLGTSSGAPTKSRNVAGIVVKKANNKSWCLVDCGEGTQHQILHTNLSLSNLEAIFITHVHGDHCFGLPGLLATATMSGRTDELILICPESIKKWILDTCEMSEMRFSYELKFHIVEDFESFELKYFDIDITTLSHRVPSYAFGFTENDLQRKLDVEKLEMANITQGPIWGQIQKEQDVMDDCGQIIHHKDFLLPKDSSRKIVIAGDNDQPDLLSNIIKNASVLVHEATFTQKTLEKVGARPQHCSAKAIAIFAHKNNVENLILTHFSARYQGEMILEIENEARANYDGILFLAKDFNKFILNSKRKLEYKL